jgi:hypothetical protein
MHYAHKLLLLALTTTAILALLAPAASALEIGHENGQHCSNITIIDHGIGSSGCKFHATSEAPIEIGSPLGMTLCEMEFEGRMDEDGEGFVYNQQFINCGPLPVIPCSETGVKDNWEVHLDNETRMEWRLCFDILGLEINCHLTNIHIGEPIPHQYEFFTEGHQPCEFPFNDSSLAGHWNQERSNLAAHPNIEIRD